MSKLNINQEEALRSFKVNGFNSHVNYSLKEFLNPWCTDCLKKFSLPEKGFHKEIKAIIVEDRPSNLLKFCILNTLLMCRLKIRISIYTISKSVKELSLLFSGLEEWVEIIDLGKLNISSLNRITYNNLLKTSEFWDLARAEKVLVIQTDSLIIDPFDFSFFNFDFIGSPWVRNKISISFPVFSKDLLNQKGIYWAHEEFNMDINMSLLIGNGGLSIRNTRIMKKICESELSYKGEPEDVYFSRYLAKYSEKIPQIDIAKRFSCETEYYPSIGSHASYLYLSCSEQAEIYDRHFKNLIGLTLASYENIL